MLLAGSDVVLKIQGEDNFESIFRKRKKYYCSGISRNLGKNSILYFVLKESVKGEYALVGDANPHFAGRLYVRSKDELDFSGQHNWDFVIDLTNLREYPRRFPVQSVFPIEVIKKLHEQRPFGIELTSEQRRTTKETIAKKLLSDETIQPKLK